jgi:cell division protein FtsI (penicillin-binding protein 3)
VPDRIEDGSFEGALVAAGDGARATPLEIARAYSIFIDGTYAKERVIRPETARTVRTMLEEVVHGPMGTGKAAAIPGHRIAGKTGTSGDPSGATYASFVGFFPSENPRYIIYIGIDSPKDSGTGGKAASPVFARIASRL